MTEEFELTFLIKELPENFSLEETPFKEILDIYLPTVSDHAILRIRKQGEVFEITKKTPVSGTDSSHQNENTIPLSKEEFEELSALPGKRVRKIRYYYTENDTTYEIDIFQDSLQGLILVDVEFTSHVEKENFVAPNWTLADITQEKFIAGGVLAGKSYEDIKTSLAQYSYEKLLF